MARDIRAALEAIRAIQRWAGPGRSPRANAPNYCLAASKFTVGKLVGLFPRDATLDQFLASAACARAARRLGHAKSADNFVQLKADLGGKLSRNESFNQVVLPAMLEWGGLGAKGVSFRFDSNAATADARLDRLVPMVVGVDLPGGHARDHFVTLLRVAGGEGWVVDSWHSSEAASVVTLPKGGTLSGRMTVSMNAGLAEVPCKPGFFGWYVQGGKPMGLAIAL
jgi:hypothetical protein